MTLRQFQAAVAESMTLQQMTTVYLAHLPLAQQPGLPKCQLQDLLTDLLQGLHPGQFQGQLQDQALILLQSALKVWK